MKNQKTLVVLLGILLVPGANALAQKTPAQIAVNLERALARAVQPKHAIKAWAPVRLIKTEQFNVFPADIPTPVTPVNASLALRAKSNANAANMYTLGLEFVLGPYSILGYGRAYYSDATKLAQDLNAYYHGRAKSYTDASGREVKLYALPVDGILYQPNRQEDVQVLNSREHFVIYDVADRTGRIAPNVPAVYNTFVYDEIRSALGTPKVFDSMSNLCDSILILHLHKSLLDPLYRLGVAPKIGKVVRANRAAVYKQVNTPDELLPYLKTLPRVRRLSDGFEAYVVELPVSGLSWVEENGATHVYNPNEHVMLVFEYGEIDIFRRDNIENPSLFTALPATHSPQEPSWAKDRRGGIQN